MFLFHDMMTLVNMLKVIDSLPAERPVTTFEGIESAQKHLS